MKSKYDLIKHKPATGLPASDVPQMKELFDFADYNRDGKVSPKEL